MKMKHWPEIAQIKSIVFGADKACDNVFVYLHGAGEFRKGFDGQYEYPGFASLLRDGEMVVISPFIIACCMDSDQWPLEQLSRYLDEVSSRFNKAEINIIGYSRGGRGVYDLLNSGKKLRSATVINSRLPASIESTHIPIHIIHASDDQHTPLSTVQAFIEQRDNEHISLTVWEGDHFSIESIARSGVWRT